jgi:uncharacterized membrane protein YqaE (UPF0057 family)
MKTTITMLSFIFLFVTSSYAVTSGNYLMKLNSHEEFNPISSDLPSIGIDDFLNLTPKKYKELTGEKLGLKNSLKLKAAQKYIKKEMKDGGADDGISSGLYILLAILGLGWVAMGVKDDWSGKNWITNLILTALCWLPGLIHALAKKNDYF